MGIAAIQVMAVVWNSDCILVTFPVWGSGRRCCDPLWSCTDMMRGHNAVC